MPFTPFHFGPGLVAKAIAAPLFSWSAFVVTQVVIDVETLVNIVRRSYPLHRFLHTFPGSTLVAVGVIVVFLAGSKASRSAVVRSTSVFVRRVLGAETSATGIVTGSLIGAWSHVVLDGIMHGDVVPFSPFAGGNPFWRWVGVSELHAYCVFAGLLGSVGIVAWWLVVRK